MTGYQSKKAAALDEDGMYLVHHTQPAQEPQTCKGRKCQASNENGFDHSPECIADTARDQGWSTTPPQPAQEHNFCSRCGKRTADLTTIHTCTPPHA